MESDQMEEATSKTRHELQSCSLHSTLLICTTVHTMNSSYEWDSEKARQNLQKHRVDFAEAIYALDDPLALTLCDPDADIEERLLTLGTDSLGRPLVVAYTWRGASIRIISARKATRRERRQYQGR
jgi:uncharacterized DUF497 family protein